MKKFVIICILFLFTSLTSELWANFYSGKQSFAAKNFKNARKHFKAAIKYNPNHGDSYFYLGYMDEIEGKYKTSIDYFQKAVNRKMTSKLRNYSFLKIINYYKYHQNWEMVYQYCQRRLQYGNNSGIRKILDKAANLRNPELIEANKKIQLANAHIASGEYEEAETLLREAVGIQPDLYKAIFSLGLVLQSNGKNEDAIKYFLQLTDKFPDNSLYFFRLGYSQMKTGKFSEALASLKKAQNLDKIPSDQKYIFYVSMGKSYDGVSNFSKAAFYYRKALKIKPKAFTPALGIAKIEYLKGRYRKSLIYLQKIIKKKPQDPKINYYLGMIYYRKRQQSRAMDYLTEMVHSLGGQIYNAQIKNEYGDGFLNLAYLHSFRDSFTDAVKYFKIAKPDLHNKREYNFYYGKSLYYTGNMDGALAYLHKVENSSGALYLIAKIQAKYGKVESIKDYINKAVKIKQTYWYKSLKEPAFQNLFKQYPEFKRWVLYRGSPPPLPKTPKDKLKEKKSPGNVYK